MDGWMDRQSFGYFIFPKNDTFTQTLLLHLNLFPCITKSENPVTQKQMSLENFFEQEERAKDESPEGSQNAKQKKERD